MVMVITMMMMTINAVFDVLFSCMLLVSLTAHTWSLKLTVSGRHSIISSKAQHCSVSFFNTAVGFHLFFSTNYKLSLVFVLSGKLSEIRPPGA